MPNLLLVIVESSAIRQALSECLRARGFAAIGAATFTEAMSQSSVLAPDLVIADDRPKAAHRRALHHEAPLLVYSHDDLVRFTTAGSDGKPPEAFEDLIRAIRRRCR